MAEMKNYHRPRPAGLGGAVLDKVSPSFLIYRFLFSKRQSIMTKRVIIFWNGSHK